MNSHSHSVDNYLWLSEPREFYARDPSVLENEHRYLRRMHSYSYFFFFFLDLLGVVVAFLFPVIFLDLYHNGLRLLSL